MLLLRWRCRRLHRARGSVARRSYCHLTEPSKQSPTPQRQNAAISRLWSFRRQAWHAQQQIRAPCPACIERFSCNENFWTEALVLSGRSEEHTSELQSLMRISYAVFCLTKKKYQ